MQRTTPTKRAEGERTDRRRSSTPHRAGGKAVGTGPFRRRRRPGRKEIERIGMDLVARRDAEIRGTARRYAATPDDADDAYQLGLEILLTKAPTTSEEELVPWLKTVVIRTFAQPLCRARAASRAGS